MKDPKFKIGAKAYYPHIDKYGHIVRVINQKDPEDVAIQGFRYEVQIRGKLWSIREASLSHRKDRRTRNSVNNQARAEG